MALRGLRVASKARRAHAWRRQPTHGHGPGEDGQKT
ncbi:unnamed protein product, partial [Amoebophrya sp. A120]|eukprot:GSA120T00024172001.1